MQPLLTVVIPTYRRAKSLPRAIASALAAAPDGDVEVLVVPNGQDDSWTAVAHAFAADRRVAWHPLQQANACAARNHGLRLASGKHLRFLDDDDYLLPAAATQLELHDAAGVEITSGPQENISPTGENLGITLLPATDDFVAAALRATAISLTQGSIYLRRGLEGDAWPEDASRYHDYLWCIALASRRERSWLRLDQPVAAYCRHFDPRISRSGIGRESSALVVDAIQDLHARLEQTSRNTPARDLAAATALLTHAHTAFSGAPLYLSRTISSAYVINRSARPAQKLFARFPALAWNLLITEWGLLGPAYFYRGYRHVTWLGGRAKSRLLHRDK